MKLKVTKGGNEMETNKGMVTETQTQEHESMKSALFATLIFVGGTIVAFIILLLVIFIARI